MTLWHQVLDYLSVNGEDVRSAVLQHLYLALVPVVVAFVLSLPLGWAVVSYGWVRHPLLTLTSVVYTIPSLALLLLLPGLLGTSILDPFNVLVALTVYSLALLVRSTADGLAAIDASVVQAATAMGYRPLRRWFAVDLPLSLPVVLAGLRVAVVSNVSMVSIAALVGIGGLGQLFTRGFQLGFYMPPILIGLVLSVAIALVLDALVVIAQRFVTPWARVAAR
ncbi:ABC transporter permease [Nocardioides sp. TRM66260-LWL]|uniref:ABC transporter permease n=1 Tax=Nocardioides sp. TRM66260-LWL TaxID=2874478 RepID=UPI001CC74DDE|nr:ABC transporter permease [Nocardioides sp. TRM66260-LWL]MBZ5735758.1 ABC transporter permease [Nocardioides sp. TRM66260-LWL]